MNGWNKWTTNYWKVGLHSMDVDAPFPKQVLLVSFNISMMHISFLLIDSILLCWDTIIIVNKLGVTKWSLGKKTLVCNGVIALEKSWYTHTNGNTYTLSLIDHRHIRLWALQPMRECIM